ncbi:Bud-site selection protein, partial [Trichoderma barbatum]
MPKRKRTVADTVQNKLEKYRIDIFRALSAAKVHERKRFSNKLHEPGITVAKKTRLEREYAVLKGLDLRQTARHHLHSNLLRIKAIETSNDIPEELRAEVPRPALSPEEVSLRNNVISILCNAGPARQALDRAVADICETLGVPVPTKSKRVRNKRKDTEEQPADREGDEDDEDDEDDEESAKPAAKSSKKREALDEEADEESEFEGFSSDADEPRPTIEELEGSDQENALSKYADLLGGSSDEEEEEFDEELLAKYRGTEKVNLDDISISGSGSEDEGDDEEEEDLESITGSRSPSPLPRKKSKNSAENEDDEKPAAAKATKTKKEKKEEEKQRRAKAAAKTARSGDSTFLPTLMGGYISGSESASDIEAPPKKRRGQRARQAIWEKKYGASAKHLQKAATKGGRDAGWDMKRGAVGPEDQGRGKPWKKGGRPATGDSRSYSQGRGGNDREQTRAPPKPTKKDNEGPLHPSWEARKKAKEAQQNVAFAGSKVVF